MAKWPDNPRLINTRIPRLDGMAKASGKAKYPSDVRPEGTLFGVMLYSPHAHAKVKSIDAADAEKMPGVKADVTIETTYSVLVITHVCLESHGSTARWDGEEKIVAWASTQSVRAVADELARTFKVPVGNVTVLTEVMGGGFGSKFAADIW